MSWEQPKSDLSFWSEDQVESQFPVSYFNINRSINGLPAKNQSSNTTTASLGEVLDCLEDYDGGECSSEKYNMCTEDDVFSHLPCRILDDWYLRSKIKPLHHLFVEDHTSFPDRRAPLPINSQDLKDYELMGLLQPQHPQQDTIRVKLTELDYYTIEHSREWRGYWVVTSKARYWLHSPCSKSLHCPTRIKFCVGGEVVEVGGPRAIEKDSYVRRVLLPSQEMLHQFHRAQLGLLSNLIDIFISPKDISYNFSLQNLRFDQIHNFLTPATSDLFVFHKERKRESGQQYPKLFRFPFDLNLLCSTSFLLPHIRAIHPEAENSSWYQDLESRVSRQMTSDQAGGLQTKELEEKWRQSSRKAERRSCQLPTGAPVQGSHLPDLLYPMELELAFLQNQGHELRGAVRNKVDVSIGSDINRKDVSGESHLVYAGTSPTGSLDLPFEKSKEDSTKRSSSACMQGSGLRLKFKIPRNCLNDNAFSSNGNFTQ